MSSVTLFGLCAPRLSITTIRPSFRLGASAFLQGLVFDLSSERLHDPGRPGKCVACSFPFSALLMQLPRLRPYLPQLTRQADLLHQAFASSKHSIAVSSLSRRESITRER